MSIKSSIKNVVVGKPGNQPRRIRIGLLRGLRFMVDTNSQSMRLLGLAETEITSCVRRLARRAGSAMDIGANDGWYALYFASRPNIARVLAFDADLKALATARQNLELNSPDVLRKATLVPKMVGTKSDAQWCTVDEMSRDLPEPILLKIDVDGGEMDVLRGAEKTLTQRACSLVIETHTVELERECLQTLKDLKYECRIIDNGWYRGIFPEARHIPHNRWMVAEQRR